MKTRPWQAEEQISAAVFRENGQLEWTSRLPGSPPWFDAAARLGQARDALDRVPGVRTYQLVSGEGSGPHRILALHLPTPAVPCWLERATLTPRQLEVARLAACGATVREAATHLGISMHTVRQHLKQVYRELDVANRVELLRALIVLGHTT